MEYHIMFKLVCREPKKYTSPTPLYRAGFNENFVKLSIIFVELQNLTTNEGYSVNPNFERK